MDGERRASSTMPALGTRTRRDRATKKSPGAGAERQGTKRETAEDSFSVRAGQCIGGAYASFADDGWRSRMLVRAIACVRYACFRRELLIAESLPAPYAQVFQRS
jgi:hypothetical protein